jgi:hypothetical protein
MKESITQIFVLCIAGGLFCSFLLFLYISIGMPGVCVSPTPARNDRDRYIGAPQVDEFAAKEAALAEDIANGKRFFTEQKSPNPYYDGFVSKNKSFVISHEHHCRECAADYVRGMSAPKALQSNHGSTPEMREAATLNILE